MPKIHPLIVNIGCATCFIQVGRVASAAILGKRAAQRTNQVERVSAINNSPLIVYASDSSPTSSQASSPTIDSRSLLFVVLSGAGAFSIITLAFVIIYKRYKAHKAGTSRSGDVRANGGSPVQKSQIRHITHDEQKERYRSLFGVPAGYLRPKSRMSLAPQPKIQSQQVAPHSNVLGEIRFDVYNHARSSSSVEMQSDSGTFACQVEMTEDEAYWDRKDRKTRLINFQEEKDASSDSKSGENEMRPAHITPRFPNLLARLKSIKQKTVGKSDPNMITPYHLNTPTPNNLQSILTNAAEVNLERPRSPSIAPTPPSYIKSPVIQRPLDLTIVTGHLERHMSQLSSLSGRGDSYYCFCALQSATGNHHPGHNEVKNNLDVLPPAHYHP
ncbi:hypothetical protein MJO28_006979 [Puccinia striiformis f. sp. tritici]|uniref:Uncharacterized protein n=3 Tax=Puccinia striiformis TaxID=27350 RepID=A0A2S4VWD7_9BASI|nr:hypothetical protein MJO28_006979 [Puccinia striiformis f. sp. tritici]POW13810.1 hypothetical protein PSTT_03505 [Puccinia striiformis]POW18106.1 hypothetical protein PSHT_06171 [Puccinia striiformis]